MNIIIGIIINGEPPKLTTTKKEQIGQHLRRSILGSMISDDALQHGRGRKESYYTSVHYLTLVLPLLPPIVWYDDDDDHH